MIIFQKILSGVTFSHLQQRSFSYFNYAWFLSTNFCLNDIFGRHKSKSKWRSPIGCFPLCTQKHLAIHNIFFLGNNFYFRRGIHKRAQVFGFCAKYKQNFKRAFKISRSSLFLPLFLNRNKLVVCFRNKTFWYHRMLTNASFVYFRLLILEEDKIKDDSLSKQLMLLLKNQKSDRDRKTIHRHRHQHNIRRITNHESRNKINMKRNKF